MVSNILLALRKWCINFSLTHLFPNIRLFNIFLQKKCCKKFLLNFFCLSGLNRPFNLDNLQFLGKCKKNRKTFKIKNPSFSLSKVKAGVKHKVYIYA